MWLARYFTKGSGLHVFLCNQFHKSITRSNVFWTNHDTMLRYRLQLHASGKDWVGNLYKKHFFHVSWNYMWTAINKSNAQHLWLSQACIKLIQSLNSLLKKAEWNILLPYLSVFLPARLHACTLPVHSHCAVLQDYADTAEASSKLVSCLQEVKLWWVTPTCLTYLGPLWISGSGYF